MGGGGGSKSKGDSHSKQYYIDKENAAREQARAQAKAEQEAKERAEREAEAQRRDALRKQMLGGATGEDEEESQVNRKALG